MHRVSLPVRKWKTFERGLLEIVDILWRKLGLIDLKEFNQDFIWSGNHDIFPETQIGNIFLQNHTVGLQLIHHLFNMVGLNSEMMDISSHGVFGWLVIEMEPAIADSDKYVSLTRKY